MQLTWWERAGLTAEQGKALEDYAGTLIAAGLDCDPLALVARLQGPSAVEIAAMGERLKASLKQGRE